MSEQYRVAIAGATGAVGVEFLRLLEERHFPISKLLLLASARSAGKTMRFDGRDVLVEELTEDSFDEHRYRVFQRGRVRSRRNMRRSRRGRARWWSTTLRPSAWIRRCRW